MTNDPQRPERGRPEDPASGRQDPMQGGQDPMQGRQDPGPGGQAPRQGGQQGGGSHRARLGVLTGLLGLIALGGVTAGLVAANAAPTTPTVAPTHVPTHASTSPSASPTTSAKRLISVTGSASARSGSFVMPTSTESVHYTYTCPSSLATSPHGFAAQIENAGATDILPVAASRNMTGSGTVTVHPKNVGSAYHIVTTTNCPYTIRVDSP